MKKIKKILIVLVLLLGIIIILKLNNTYAKTGYITNNKLTYITIENGETLISGFEIGEKVSDILKNFSEEYSLKIKNNEGKDITSELEAKIGTGYKIEIYNSQETLEKIFTIVVYGDTNDDGEIGAVDALAIIKNKLWVTMFENKATEEAGRTNIETRSNNEIPKADDALLVIKHKLYETEYPIEQRIIKTTNEDYNAPKISNIQTNVDGLKITITATVSDTASSNAKEGISEISSIEYSINGENYQESNEFTVESPGNYTIYIKAVDKSENETIVTKNVIVSQYTLTIKHYLENIEDTNYTCVKTTNVGNIINNTTITLSNYKETIENGTYNYGSLTESVSGAENSKIETTNVKENITICLYYKRNTYNLTLVKGEGISNVTGQGRYKVGKVVPINATIGNYEGYDTTWINWTSDKQNLISDANITNQSSTITMPAGDITLTANGSKILKTYTITYNLNGGTGEIQNQTKTHGQSIKLSGVIPTRTEYGLHDAPIIYNFLGWSTNKDATGAMYEKNETYTENGDITLYAVWEREKNIITFSNTNVVISNYRHGGSYETSAIVPANCEINLEVQLNEIYTPDFIERFGDIRFNDPWVWCDLSNSNQETIDRFEIHLENSRSEYQITKRIETRDEECILWFSASAAGQYISDTCFGGNLAIIRVISITDLQTGAPYTVR